jgi:hypothetical protein
VLGALPEHSQKAQQSHLSAACGATRTAKETYVRGIMSRHPFTLIKPSRADHRVRSLPGLALAGPEGPTAFAVSMARTNDRVEHRK